MHRESKNGRETSSTPSILLVFYFSPSLRSFSFCKNDVSRMVERFHRIFLPGIISIIDKPKLFSYEKSSLASLTITTVINDILISNPSRTNSHNEIYIRFTRKDRKRVRSEKAFVLERCVIFCFRLRWKRAMHLDLGRSRVCT